MKAYFCVLKFYDDGRVEAEAYCSDELIKYPEYLESLKNAGYLQCELYDLYVDEYNSMVEAIHARNQARKVDKV